MRLDPQPPRVSDLVGEDVRLDDERVVTQKVGHFEDRHRAHRMLKAVLQLLTKHCLALHRSIRRRMRKLGEPLRL